MRNKNPFLLIILTLSLVFSFFVNLQDIETIESLVTSSNGYHAELLSGDISFVEIVCNEDLLSVDAQVLVSNTYKNSYRNSISMKYLKIILIACVQACLFAQALFRFLWVSEKATTRSQKSIIEYIHNKDGRKA